jgi:hypothetical protein
MYKLLYLIKNYFISPLIIFLSLGVLLLSASCIYHSKDSSLTFFGGIIKNPKGEYVYFAKNWVHIDTARIDSKNKFSFHLDSIEPGFYTFHHSDEYQVIYLEPNDSLQIYLNTWDFDESLIYSGTQANKNNYLIGQWLHQEKFQKNFHINYGYGLNEKEFNKVIESELSKRLQTYNDLLVTEEENPSIIFDKLVKIGINFPLYYLKEVYPFENKHALKLDALPNLSDSYYDYYDNVDFNDEWLLVFGPYREYLYNYIRLKAQRQYLENPEENNLPLNYMKIVNEEITIESLKNKLLVSRLWFAMNDTGTSNNEMKSIEDYFFKNCSDELMIEEVKISKKQKNQFKHGDKFPEVNAFDIKGNKVSVNDIAKNNNTVIYFWPKQADYIQSLYAKLVKLEKDYPDWVFIGIERDKTSEDWVKFVKSKNLSEDNQFLLSKESNAYSFFEGDMDRTIILNEHGNVQNGYLFFNSHNFDIQLKKLNKH